MQRVRTLTFATLVCLCGIFTVSSGQAVHEKTGPSSGKLSFKTPDLSDEEAYSLHLPQELKCDACRIVAYTMKERFDAAHKKRPSLKVLPESEILDILDEICTDKWENIGLKEIEGVKRLSGPGLETKDVPGVMQGGGKWPNSEADHHHHWNPNVIYEYYEEEETGMIPDYDEDYLDPDELAFRQKYAGILGPGKFGMFMDWLNQQCAYYIGEYGEEEIYEIYKENPKKFEKWLCYGEDGDCTPKEEPKKKKGKKNKKSEL
ncbi:marginal zone B- and B1-cell-specific protein-like [Ptychodera flava]|uniref:marginal zone B- and B1-cell-specific protein-like n=1 Tax=Ptychodera flava TaxID=63121 RepID=UPI003969D05D